MSEAPERIFVTSNLIAYEEEFRPLRSTEYVRADRIEELEAKLARYDDLVADKINLRSENETLKAKLAKAVEALRFLKSEIRGHGFSDEGRMLVNCSSTLAELTGGGDETGV